MISVADGADLPLNTADKSPVVLTSELRKVYRTGFWLNQKNYLSQKLFSKSLPRRNFWLTRTQWRWENYIAETVTGNYSSFLWTRFIIR